MAQYIGVIVAIFTAVGASAFITYGIMSRATKALHPRVSAALEPALRNILRDYKLWQEATTSTLSMLETVPRQLQDHNWIITGIVNHLAEQGFDPHSPKGTQNDQA